MTYTVHAVTLRFAADLVSLVQRPTSWPAKTGYVQKTLVGSPERHICMALNFHVQEIVEFQQAWQARLRVCDTVSHCQCEPLLPFGC